MKPIPQKRALAAEDACRAIRHVICKRVVDQTSEDWAVALGYLSRWIRLAGKRGGGKPRGRKPNKRED